MRDLHHLGFDQMASAIFGSLQSRSSMDAQQLPTDPLFFDLAWRTGDWDLPTITSSKFPESGELFYTVLRAVHRERDIESTRKVLQMAIGVEIDRLKTLGLERMAQIKEKTRRLLCLREVDTWLESGTTEALLGGDQGIDPLRSFSDLNGAFR
jgi:ataxia telangiectasia mutated family protein